jgi:hypothetical protein
LYVFPLLFSGFHSSTAVVTGDILDGWSGWLERAAGEGREPATSGDG